MADPNGTTDATAQTTKAKMTTTAQPHRNTPDSAATVSSEPIAVVGIACRLPGAPDPDAFWRLLEGGEDAITQAPPERWAPQVALRAPFGGFIEGVDRFDAQFFGISPREAAAMDPQQRLMLELGWEALEDARVVPDELRGTRTGVFVGAIADDYARLMQRAGTDGITQHTVTGTHRGIIANRVSYFLDLHGPSLTVDTAQSSALVAVRMACESLARGESELAIAGGVSLNILAETTLSTEKFGGLSPDGRCYTFDERANGYVRGEGGGALLLKPYARALADGDRVHWIILGAPSTATAPATASPCPAGVHSKRSSGAPIGKRASTRRTSSTWSCMAPVPRSATRSRQPPSAPPWARTAPPTNPSSSARPRRTSATWRAPRASSAC